MITLIDFGTSLYIQHGIQPDDDGYTQLENKKKTNVAIGAKIIKAIVVIWALIFITNLFLDMSWFRKNFTHFCWYFKCNSWFAAQSVIGNFIAGIQVAMTKPVKIGIL
ncbi:hypothetical protein GO491_07310 [Flavobacteriaceae bacterium Ap0902]|nr:hypothetical protein [Flavobacteriaceae bacterium Ap0902]